MRFTTAFRRVERRDRGVIRDTAGAPDRGKYAEARMMSVLQITSRIWKRIVRQLLSPARTLVRDIVFNSYRIAQIDRRQRVLCLGDSHVAVMRYVHLDGVFFNPKPVSGATASGVVNPNSKTSAYRAFSERLARAPRWQHVLVQLGEVDCGFVIWHRARRHGLSSSDQLEQTLDSYMRFIREVAKMGFRSVSVLSVPLPTITDYPSQWGEVANARKEITASQRERTELTMGFNEELRRRCAGGGVTFIDATTCQQNPKTGIIDPRFVRKGTDQVDHHLNDGEYAQLIAARVPEHLWGPVSAC